jgi:hypothetical protein
VAPLAAFPPVDTEGRREMDFFNREKREGAHHIAALDDLRIMEPACPAAC